MPRPAGEVHSIRLPAGAAADLKELLGMSVSTFCRQQVLASIELAKREKEKQA